VHFFDILQFKSSQQMNNQSPLPQDELDIEEFFTKLYRVGVKAFAKAIFPFQLLWLRPMLLLLVIVLSSGISYITYRFVPKTYAGTFVIKPIDGSDLTLINDLYTLQIAAKDKDEVLLAELLQLPSDVTQTLKAVNATAIKKFKQWDTLDLMSVELRISDRTYFDTIVHSIYHYIENTAHYTKVKSLRIKQLNSNKKKIEEEMNELDSLKKIYANNISPRDGKGFVFGEPLNPIPLYEKEFMLFKQRISIEWQENYLNNIEIISISPPTSKPFFPRFVHVLLAFLGISMIILIRKNYLLGKQQKAF
jgi:hypothetical protein